MRFNTKTYIVYFLAALLSISCQDEAYDPVSDPEDIQVRSYPDLQGSIRTIVLDGQEVEVTFSNGQYFMGGDMLVVPDEYKQNAPQLAGRSAGVDRAWPNNTLYYKIEPGLPNTNRVLEGIDHVVKSTNVLIKERIGDGPYVLFKKVPKEEGCFSSYGFQNVLGQVIGLSDTCHKVDVIHEIGHALGLYHEQARADRDQYVKIHFENVLDDKVHNFQTYTALNMQGRELTAFDFQSVMMYYPWAHSKNKKMTITKLDGSRYDYQYAQLSALDIEGINILYPKITTPDPTTDPDPTPSPDPEVTQLVPGTIISLIGSNGKFVSSENGLRPMNCNRNTNDGWWEQFEVVATQDDGWISLRSRGDYGKNNERFVSSENGLGAMTCNRLTNDGWWEHFKVVQAKEGRISLQSRGDYGKDNQKFMSSENGEGAMTCNRLTNDNRAAQFKVIQVNR